MDPTPGRRSGFVCGNTRIAQPEGQVCTIADVVERLHRGSSPSGYSLDADGLVHLVHLTSVRREEGEAEVLLVELDDGTVVHATAGQLFLGVDGDWAMAKDLSAGVRLLTVEDPHQWKGAGGAPVERPLAPPRAVVDVRHALPRAVYEFRVEQHHNLVHPSGIVLHD